MLRKFIKALIPSKGDIFFTLFEEAAINSHQAAKIFVDILNCENDNQLVQLFATSKLLKQKSVEINKKVLVALNNLFITPIDRGDIQELSSLLTKLTKRIVKISTKLKIYDIGARTDDCLIKNAKTLLTITEALVNMLHALKHSEISGITSNGDKIYQLEEGGIEDFRYAMNEMYSGNLDTLTIIKLKEIYKSIDSAIELCVTASDLVTQISVKSI